MVTIVHPIFPVNKAGSSDQVSAVLNELEKDSNIIIGDSIHVETDNNFSSNKDNVVQSSIYKLTKTIQSKPKNHHILLTADPVMIDTVKQIKDEMSNKDISISSILTSHKFNKDVNLAIRNKVFDLVGVPSDEIPSIIEKQTQEKLIPMNFVPTTNTLASFHKEFQKCIEEGVLKANILNQKNHLIVLPGDFSNSKTQKLEQYTTQEARDLARYLVNQREEGEFLFVCDGPRTGKHDKNGNVYEKSHQIGAKTNPVMAAFIDELEKQDLEEGIHFKSFEFKFKSKTNPYKALMYAASQSGKKISIDGSSVSMLGSDTADLPEDVNITGLGSKSIFDSTAHNQSFVKISQYADIIIPKEDTFTLIEKSMPNNRRRNNDANLVATKILEKVGHSFTISTKHQNHKL